MHNGGLLSDDFHVRMAREQGGLPPAGRDSIVWLMASDVPSKLMLQF